MIIRNLATLVLSLVTATAIADGQSVREFVEQPKPPGFSVRKIDNSYVMVDKRGMTLYTVAQGKDELAKFLSTLFAPALASDDAAPVGKWTLAERADGKRQWMFDGLQVVNFRNDLAPGDATGARGPAKLLGLHEPVPPTLLPPGFTATWKADSWTVSDPAGMTVYVSTVDAAKKKQCTGECTQRWLPVRAPLAAEAVGSWTIVSAADGTSQWAFDGKPVFVSRLDVRPADVQKATGEWAPLALSGENIDPRLSATTAP